MPHPEIQPERRTERDEDVFSHPAYGVVILSHVHGGGGNVFGSDIGHLGRMRISVRRATLHRHLNRDWIHGHGQELLDFEMTHAQFAEFITGVGKGEGTPITLRRAPETHAVSVPGIAKIESKNDTFRREIRDAAIEKLDKMRAEVVRLVDLIESGKTPRAELRDIAANLARHVGQLPGNLEFVVSSAEEALEKATTDAKIEVEAFIGAKAKQLGLESIQQLAQLGHDGGANGLSDHAS